jgi:hypothetical protein
VYTHLGYLNIRQYPKLADHHDRVEALKGVKEYLAGPDRQAKINYNGLG